MTIFKFISGNFEQEKARTKNQLEISFKYFYDTSVGENTMDPKFKEDKTIDPNVIDIEKMTLNNKDKVYDHIKISKESHSKVKCTTNSQDNCWHPITETNTFQRQDINDILLDDKGKLSKAKKRFIDF